MTIISASGKTLVTQKITESHTRISLTELPPAVYSAIIGNQEVRFNRKFVKTR